MMLTIQESDQRSKTTATLFEFWIKNKKENAEYIDRNSTTGLNHLTRVKGGKAVRVSVLLRIGPDPSHGN